MPRAEGRHPIRVVARLTGIPIDTLRAWERRYAAVEPSRDQRGRLYSDGEVRRLRMLRLLVDRGHAIGRIAALPEAELESLLAAAAPAQPPAARAEPGAVEALLDCLERYDAAGLDRELGRQAALLQARELVREVALPLMRRVGEAWEAGRLALAQEHLASVGLRSLLGALLRLAAPREARAALVFATPPRERHELGLLGAAVLAASGGLGILYLGPELPAAEVLQSARRIQARAIVLAVTGAEDASAALEAVAGVARDLPRGVELWAGGGAPRGLVARLEAAGATWLPDFDALENALRRLGARLGPPAG